ncbi:MAG: hypothetical protein K6B72_12930 [Lachnospiraceae bacterium]|nr:hypothetical protein [Lachnospiraceae bacterium]
MRTIEQEELSPEKQRNVMNREQATAVIRELAADCYGHDNLYDFPDLELRETDSQGSPIFLRLPVVFMAIHLKMYSEAGILLDHADDFTDAEQLKGHITQELKGYDMDRTFTPGELLIAHPDIPSSLLKALYAHWMPDRPDVKRIRYYRDLVRNEYMRTFGGGCACDGINYRQTALGLWSLKCKCPEMLSGLYDFGDSSISMPSPNSADVEENRRVLRDYTFFLRVLYECRRDQPEKLELLINKTHFGFAQNSPEDFVTYEQEYENYIRTVTGMKSLFEIAAKNQTHPYGNYCMMLLSVIASLYVVWTNRFGQASPKARGVIRKWIRELRRDFRKAAGRNIWWFIRQLFAESTHRDVFDTMWAFFTLLRHVCGYDLKVDVTKPRELEIISQGFTKEQTFTDQRIVKAIDGLEQLGDFIRTDTVFGYPGKYRKSCRMLEDIAERILKLDNEELLEVALRKRLIPPALYHRLMESAAEDGSKLMPCLIAYSAAYEKP